MDIEWEDPPEDALVQQARTRYQVLASQMREHPGKWAVVKSGTNQKSAMVTASQIRGNKIAAFSEGRFEAVAKDGKVWARCVPDVE